MSFQMTFEDAEVANLELAAESIIHFANYVLPERLSVGVWLTDIWQCAESIARFANVVLPARLGCALDLPAPDVSAEAITHYAHVTLRDHFGS